MPAAQKVCDLRPALTRMGGDIALLKQLAVFCCEDLPKYLGRLKAAVAAGQPQEIRQAAHSIKGMVVNFDATAAADAAQRLEQMGQSNDLREAPFVARSLDEEITRLMAALPIELAKL